MSLSEGSPAHSDDKVLILPHTKLAFIYTSSKANAGGGHDEISITQ